MKRLIATLACFFLIAPAAHAGLSVTTSTTQAGAPAQVTIDASFATAPSSVTLHLPPGLVGNPKSADHCPPAQFEGLGCPPSSQVGTATANGFPGAVYNLEPNADEPARLGISVAGMIKNEASVSLRPDGGLDSTIPELHSLGMPVTSLGLTLASSFMTLPTSCQPATVVLNGQSAQFTPTGCATVPFNPSLGAQLETTQRAVPSGATVTLTLPPSQSHVRRTEIALPVGTALSPGVADGLAACTQAQFDGAGCPAASQVGSVRFETPVLDPLTGQVFFGDGFRLYVKIAGQGVQVKLAGDVKLDPNTGQITTVFDDLPQVPFTKFELSFKGGPHAVLANPPTCGTKQIVATLTPWSGNAAKQATAAFTIDKGCALAFAPTLSVAAASTVAGRPAGAVTMVVSRTDADANIARVTANLPPGLAGSLKGVPACADAAADAGACPADTRVGSVSALTGTGDAPAPLAGTVSLTGPTDGGPAGLAIALPARVGPVDLGTVVLRAGILLRPDGGLTVRTRPIPQVVGGVPVTIRRLALTLDRPGFILNSSSCAPQQVSALLEAPDGTTATAAAPYQATDCAGLAFAPKLSATIGKRGATGKGARPPLSTVVTVPAGQASTALASVALPSALKIELAALAGGCPAASYAAGTCPKSSLIGTTSASTPLLPSALSGPVNLAVNAAGSLGVGLALKGAVSLPLFGTIDAGGKQLTTTFSGIPDVPLARFALNFTRSPLRLSRSACHGKRLVATARFTSHNGKTVKLSAPMKVVGCPPVASVTRSGRLRVKPGRDGAKIRSVRAGGHKVKRLKPGRHQLTVRDTAGRKWKLTVRVRR